MIHWTSEVPSTAYLQGEVTFKKLPSKTNLLAFSYETDDGIADVELRFEGVEFFACTHRSARQNTDLVGYDCVVELINTPELEAVRAGRRSNHLSDHSYRHFTFQYDGGPKYQFVCLTFSSVRRKRQL